MRVAGRASRRRMRYRRSGGHFQAVAQFVDDERRQRLPLTSSAMMSRGLPAFTTASSTGSKGRGGELFLVDQDYGVLKGWRLEISGPRPGSTPSECMGKPKVSQ